MKIINSYSPAWARSIDSKSQLRYVLTQDATGLQAVYGAIVKMPQSDEKKNRVDNWIAFHGTKLNFRDASRQFDVREENYRR